MLDPVDTIAAIASPPGPAPRGLVRLSGPRAVEIVLAAFVPDGETGWPPGRAEMRRGRWRVSGLRSTVPGSALIRPDDRSLTGEPTAEIHALGSPPILEGLLADCLTRGARLAEPGEFTLRAFLAGRLDLTAAEAVLGVIRADTPEALDVALAQHAGGIAATIRRTRDHLLDRLAHLEALLDFAEEPDVDDLDRGALASELARMADELLALADRMERRSRPDRPPRVVLSGPPNAGKSRLFNALCGAEAALVADRAGTTRDYLVARTNCDGLTIELIDTAGLESPSGAIDAAAQARRAEQVATADLVLDCRAPSQPAAPDAGSGALRVATKSDLGPTPDADRLAVSAVDGRGLDRLRGEIAARLRSRPGIAVATTAARCRDSMDEAARSLRDAAEALVAGVPDDLVAVDLRQALDALGRVVGAVVTDDVLDRIFRQFCIGK